MILFTAMLNVLPLVHEIIAGQTLTWCVNEFNTF